MELAEIEPEIWRSFRVPSDTSLRRLHDILQIAMGWSDSHLHQFFYADREPIEEDEEYEILLNTLFENPGDQIVYQYDFGDSWEHYIVLEKVDEIEKNESLPRVVDGKGKCPPEDIGGVWGFEEFLEAINDPNHPSHDEMFEWYGGKFDPDVFDIESTNRRLKEE